MIVLPETARAQVETEFAAVEPWGRARGWVTTWRPEALHLEVRMRSGIDAEEYVFGFDLSDYRALPPLIELAHPKTGELGTRRCYPKGGRGYFHEQPVLCAPWSRRAYATHGGPHADWEMTAWASNRPNHSRLGDILVLLQDLLDDRTSYGGRMAP
jgi:hypothetical protein